MHICTEQVCGLFFLQRVYQFINSKFLTCKVDWVLSYKCGSQQCLQKVGLAVIFSRKVSKYCTSCFPDIHMDRADHGAVEMKEEVHDGRDPSEKPPEGILKSVPPKQDGEPQDIREEAPSTTKSGFGKGSVL